MKPVLHPHDFSPTAFYGPQSPPAVPSDSSYPQYSDPHPQQKEPDSPQSASAYHNS